MDNFTNSLLLMAYGMIGLFVVMGAIYAGVAAMSALFSRGKRIKHSAAFLARAAGQNARRSSL